MLVARENGGGRLRAPAGEPREPVSVVADQREPVGDRRRRHAELLSHRGLVEQAPLPAVELDDPRIVDALGEILVVRADDHLLDARVVGRDPGGGGERVVGFELDHGPYRHAERPQRVLQQRELHQ